MAAGRRGRPYQVPVDDTPINGSYGRRRCPGRLAAPHVAPAPPRPRARIGRVFQCGAAQGRAAGRPQRGEPLGVWQGHSSLLRAGRVRGSSRASPRPADERRQRAAASVRFRRPGFVDAGARQFERWVPRASRLVVRRPPRGTGHRARMDLPGAPCLRSRHDVRAQRSVEATLGQADQSTRPQCRSLLRPTVRGRPACCSSIALRIPGCCARLASFSTTRPCRSSTIRWACS